ncbi:uncharacterized protein [Clytia hemisphaerica]
MSHKEIVSGINKFTKQGKRQSTTYQSESIYTSKKPKKIPKTLDFNLTAFETRVENVDNEIDGSCLNLIGVGRLSISADSDAEEVKEKIVRIVSKMKYILPSANLNQYMFIKRKGKANKFLLEVTDDDYQYNASALKNLKTKDASTVYILYDKNVIDEDAKKKTKMKPSEKPNQAIKSFKSKIMENNDEDADSDDCSSNDEGSSIDSIKSKIDNLFALKPNKKKESSIDLTDEEPTQGGSNLGEAKIVYNNLMLAVTVLANIDKFLETMDVILRDKKNELQEIEIALGMALLCIQYPREDIWDVAFDDLSDILSLTKDSKQTINDILFLILNAINHIDCKIWSENFLPIFTSLLQTKTWNEEYHDISEDANCTIVKMPYAYKCRSFEDVFDKFRARSTIETPSSLKENVTSESMFQRKYFSSTPPVLLLSMEWLLQKGMVLDSKAKLPAYLLEDVENSCMDEYRIKMVVVTHQNHSNVLVQSNDLVWRIYGNGKLKIKTKFQELLHFECVTIDLIVYNKDCKLLMAVETDLLGNGKFLMDRLQERKQSMTTTASKALGSQHGSKGKEDLEGIMKRHLGTIYGQQKLKDQTMVLARRAFFDKKRGRSTDISRLHMLFVGNPGAGKTMAARCMAGILKDIGILKKGHLVEVQRSELVSPYIGGTSQKTKAVLKKAKGGVLFIDEAYRLSSVVGKDYGKEAVETLMSEMTEPDCPLMIFAGYEKEMMEFVNVNSGLQRRIKHKFAFIDFSPNDLETITIKKLSSSFPRFPPFKTGELLNECFRKLSKEVISKHNAALCTDLIDQIQTAQESRLPQDCSDADLRKVTEDDLKIGIEAFLKCHEVKPTNEKLDSGDGDINEPEVCWRCKRSMKEGSDDEFTPPRVVPEIVVNVNG